MGASRQCQWGSLVPALVSVSLGEALPSVQRQEGSSALGVNLILELKSFPSISALRKNRVISGRLSFPASAGSS